MSFYPQTGSSAAFSRFGASYSGGFGPQDPFNYPMPGRKDLMSLSSIDADRDNMKTTTRKFATRRFESSNLSTADIQGASPKLHGSRQVNKPEFSNTNWDIERSQPAALHISLNKPEGNLNIKDIEGAYPKCVSFTSSRIGSNPLNPVYPLPKVEVRPITPPKFIRDQMSVADIQGAHPRHDWVKEARTKETNKIDDIAGTRARIRHQARKNSAGYTAEDYSDVTKAHFVSKRVVNPLSPSYPFRDENGAMTTIGAIEGNKPQTLPPRRERGDVNLSLKTGDISGAMASSKGLGVFSEAHKRRDVRVLNRTDDIDGAQSGSLKRGTTSTRVTNPLDPAYQLPGRHELVDPCSAYSRPKEHM